MEEIESEGKIEEKKGPGRRRNSWLKNLKQLANMTLLKLFRASVNVKWVSVILMMIPHLTILSLLNIPILSP